MSKKLPKNEEEIPENQPSSDFVDNREHQQALDDLDNRWKRALADYQNLEKRYAQEKADFIQYANANLIVKLLNVLDHLERAYSYSQDPGLALAIKEFNRVLNEEGLQEISADNQPFDPATMEAIGSDENGQDGYVTQVLVKGYLLKNRLVRPAKVRVGIKKE